MAAALLPSGFSDDLVKQLQGPILVTGAGGFVGANLFHRLLAVRKDVFGVVRSWPAWRLDGVDKAHVLEVDLMNEAELKTLADSIRPATVFWCAGYGAYAFEKDEDKIYRTNFIALEKFTGFLKPHGFRALVHAGSSSEYGLNCAAPREDAPMAPNSAYAVSKAAASNFIAYAGRVLGLPMVNLRLYAVYGPFEDFARLIPNLVAQGLQGTYPPLVDPDISRDFVYADDVCEAFIRAATRLTPEHYGESFNIGSGQRTTMRELAAIAKTVFHLQSDPVFGTMPPRAWDLKDWYADASKIEAAFGWKARTALDQGLQATAAWIQAADRAPDAMTKRNRKPARTSASAIIACYRDEQAIPVMYDRLTKVFRALDMDYEIIFVNDGSPDDCEGVIHKLSQTDPRVLGITHARNFGSQMAFRSGMEMATKESCILFDGDLQDPPELVADFVAKWREGFDVVYGRRVRREMPLRWEILYKAFYRLFAACSPFRVPLDAGDFSLIDKRVVGWLLRCPERDLFLRGLRAYVGFKQTGVDYVRPERMFGVSTNNLWSNIAWAKRGIFSFSHKPLALLSSLGLILVAVSILVSLGFIIIRLIAPENVPQGLTTVLLSIFFFGAINLFAVGVVGEYIAKILEEVKGRPRLIRAALIRNGEIRQILPDESRVDVTAV